MTNGQLRKHEFADGDGDISYFIEYGPGVSLKTPTGICFRTCKEINEFCRVAKAALKDSKKGVAI